MGEQAVTLSQQTYEALKRLAETTEQTVDQVIRDLALQPTTNIVARPGVQGGEPCIRDTRVPVWVLAAMHRQGDSPKEILEAYPNLSAAQVYAALSYYYMHRAEVYVVVAAQNIDHDQLRDRAA